MAFLLLLALSSSLISSTAAQSYTAASALASSYAPTYVACPAASATPLVRRAGTPSQNNQTLAQGEIAYRTGRRNVTDPLWQVYLSSPAGSGTGYNASALLAGNNTWPVAALAHSGGGYRAALYGASVVNALDSRNTTSPLAGVLQLMTYQSGLSGGSWFLSSLVLNGYPSAPELILGQNPGWLLERSLFDPDGLTGISNNDDYYDNIEADAREKSQVGFNTSITDIWGRALALHLLPGTTDSNFFQDNGGTSHGAGILFSQIASLPVYTSFSIPFPLVVATNNPPDGQYNATNSTTVIPLNTTVWEFSPLEMGSYDPYLAAFTPIELTGTYVNDGTAFVPSFVNRSSGAAGDCVNAFDQASFVYGTSSSLFNAALELGTAAFDSNTDGIIRSIINGIAGAVRSSDFLVANWPNPFQGVNGPAGFDRANDVALELTDGGENGENVPLNPLLAKARGVDVIIAADASADTSEDDAPYGGYWPNGTSLIATAKRATQILPQGTISFPTVPMEQTVWVNNQFNQRPTFFGCNETGSTPLVIYLPPSPEAENRTGYFTNTSTYKLDYSNADVQSFLDSGTASTTSGILTNGQADSQWPTCLACALLEATRFRANVSRSDACNTCFNRYCYNGTTSSGSVTPSGGGTGTGTGSTPSASAKNSGAGKAVVGWMGAGAVVAAMAVLV